MKNTIPITNANHQKGDDDLEELHLMLSGKEIGRRIAEARKRQEPQMSIRTAARAARISHAYLAEIEKGKNTPSLEVLDRICVVYGILPEMVLFKHYQELLPLLKMVDFLFVVEMLMKLMYT